MTRQTCRPEPLLELVGYLYEAVQDRAMWVGVAPRIAGMFDAVSAAVIAMTGDAFYMIAGTPDVDDAWAREYQAYYWRLTKPAHRTDAACASPILAPAFAATLGDAALSGASLSGASLVGAAQSGAVAALGDIAPSGTTPSVTMSGVATTDGVTRTNAVVEETFAPVEFPYRQLQTSGAIFHGIGSVVPLAAGENALVGIYRPSTAPPFDEFDKDRLAQFLPHLQRVLKFRQRVERSTIAATAALDRLDRGHIATVIAAHDARILHANRVARELLQGRDGIQTFAGRIAAGNRAATERLRRMIARAADASGFDRPAERDDIAASGALSLPRETGSPLTALVAPLRVAEDGLVASAVAAAVMFIADPAARPLARAPLQSLFGLTAAEAALAGTLATGRSLDDIATASGISLHTARVHLRSVFSKTGTSRQAQLVALLLRSVAGLEPHSPVSLPRSLATPLAPGSGPPSQR
ncbi:MAG TPA: helix-turn-helix transcriptional regulator [Stellaceae bacterium]|nr:helix-turn-helix transcriptional regulator [Stellaceae bacterium]